MNPVVANSQSLNDKFTTKIAVFVVLDEQITLPCCAGMKDRKVDKGVSSDEKVRQQCRHLATNNLFRKLN